MITWVVALPVPVVKSTKLKTARWTTVPRKDYSEGSKVADTGSEIRCQGGAAECTPACRPFQRLELGDTPMPERAGAEMEGKTNSPRVHRERAPLTPKAGKTGLAQPRQREVDAGLTTLLEVSQPPSRAAILTGQKRVCKNSKDGNFLVFLALP